MSRFLSSLIFIVCAAIPVLGAPSIHQPFAEIKLSDGRTLHNARLMSFNSASVFVRCDSGIFQVAYNLFPAELQPQLAQARANAQAEDRASAPPPPPRNASMPGYGPPVPAYRTPPPGPRVAQISQEEMERMELVKNKAQEWARQHFHSGALMRSPNVRIFGFDLQFSPPVSVSNRALLYAVKGRCLRACTDLASGNDLDPEEIIFTVTIDFDAMGQAEVADFSEEPGDQSEEHKQELAGWLAEQKQSRNSMKNKRNADIVSASEANRAQFQAQTTGGENLDLTAGMTQDQVRSLWGPPATIRSAPVSGAMKVQWTYFNKGRNESGLLCNVVVTFLNGRVASWGIHEELLPRPTL